MPSPTEVEQDAGRRPLKPSSRIPRHTGRGVLLNASAGMRDWQEQRRQATHTARWRELHSQETTTAVA